MSQKKILLCVIALSLPFAALLAYIYIKSNPSVSPLDTNVFPKPPPDPYSQPRPAGSSLSPNQRFSANQQRPASSMDYLRPGYALESAAKQQPLSTKKTTVKKSSKNATAQTRHGKNLKAKKKGKQPHLAAKKQGGTPLPREVGLGGKKGVVDISAVQSDPQETLLRQPKDGTPLNSVNSIGTGR